MLVEAADKVIDLSAADDARAAQLIRDAQLHILLDLNGLYSRGARPHLLAARAAPLQATHMGYGASCGAAFMDLLIADRLSLPAG